MRVGRGAVPQTDKELLARAKAMRANPTSTEAAMWRILRAKQFEGVKFARQVVIAPYIADFAARSRGLIVEIDGDTHASRDAKDARRTAWLEGQGYQVIRFTNYEVGSNLDGVAHAIGAALAALPLSQPSPQRGEGF
ncbi:endonuclease domain-containing protein [Sphingomonas sp. R-74633]|nr:endonuclease domain-containing protein [Sphingomonas sp. R-74633]